MLKVSIPVWKQFLHLLQSTYEETTLTSPSTDWGWESMRRAVWGPFFLFVYTHSWLLAFSSVMEFLWSKSDVILLDSMWGMKPGPFYWSFDEKQLFCFKTGLTHNLWHCCGRFEGRISGCSFRCGSKRVHHRLLARVALLLYASSSSANSFSFHSCILSVSIACARTQAVNSGFEAILAIFSVRQWRYNADFSFHWLGMRIHATGCLRSIFVCLYTLIHDFLRSVL